MYIVPVPDGFEFIEEPTQRKDAWLGLEQYLYIYIYPYLYLYIYLYIYIYTYLSRMDSSLLNSPRKAKTHGSASSGVPSRCGSPASSSSMGGSNHTIASKAASRRDASLAVTCS